MGQCFPGVLSSHHVEVRQHVPHPDNEEAGKNNLDLISWFQAGAVTVPTTPTNLKHSFMSVGHIQGVQMCAVRVCWSKTSSGEANSMLHPACLSPSLGGVSQMMAELT